MTPVREAVLELTTTLHNWRRDPSPENTRSLIVAGDELCGHALELERRLLAELQRREFCTCGGVFASDPSSGAARALRPLSQKMVLSQTLERCNGCGVLRLTVIGGPSVG